MPATIFHDLKIAIRLRRQVSVYYYNYNSSTVTSESFCTGHQWIINQLVSVYEAFRTVATRVRLLQQLHSNNMDKENNNSHTNDVIEMNNRFAALSHDIDDDSLLEDEEEEEVVVQDKASVPNHVTTPTSPPKEELIQEEERHFAIACALLEVEKLRQHIRKRWTDWTTTITESTSDTTTTNTTTIAREMLAASCISRYAILMAKSSIISTCVEFDAFSDFEEILKKPPTRQTANSFISHESTKKMELGQTVITTGLLTRPELNNQCGTIISTLSDDCHRYGVQLGNSTIVSVKADNLILSDNLLVGLNQVYEAVSSFDFTTVPTTGNGTVTRMCKSLLTTSSAMKQILQNRDRKALLQILVKQYLPLWFSFADTVGDCGPEDSFAYLREFHSNRTTLPFHIVLLLLCMTDSCFDCYHINTNSHQIAMDSMESLLNKLCDAKVYQNGITILENSDGMDAEGLWNRKELIHYIRTLWRPIATYFPWICGDLLLQSLRLNLIASAELPYLFWKKYMMIVHVYSMLRQEGYITIIPDIETTLIRMYRKQVFFRSGVPEKGAVSYLSSWQVSAGLNVQSVRGLKGVGVHRGAGWSKHSDNRTGLNVTEMSRLLAIVQWHDIRVHSNPAECLDEIHQIVYDEFDTLFCTPLLKTCIQIHYLESLLLVTCAGKPRTFCERWIGEYERLFVQFKPESAICFWALSLADGRSSDNDEINNGLQIVAKCFGDIFGQQYIDPPKNMPYQPLQFNPNDHSVDPDR